MAPLVILPVITSTLALVGVGAAVGACLLAYRRHPERDLAVRLWLPSGLATAIVTTLRDYGRLDHRATTTHLLAAAQVALAVASAIEWRAEGTVFHLVLAAFLAATTGALVAYDALTT